MGKDTKIEWADSTFNPWTGCTKIKHKKGSACDFCYAAAWAKRAGRPELWVDPPQRTSVSNWRQPLKWNREAERQNKIQSVFCASLADVFDHRANKKWRAELFDLMKETPYLVWLLLTKRPHLMESMIDDARGLPSNAAIGTTVEDQERADLRIPQLTQAAARFNPLFTFVSFEPLMGMIDLSKHSIGWAIVGGESGGNARPTHKDWVQYIWEQCDHRSIPFLFKQWGEWGPGECVLHPQTKTEQVATYDKGRWFYSSITKKQGEGMHVDDQPDVWRFGKNRTGRKLDGVEHNGFPAIIAG